MGIGAVLITALVVLGAQPNDVHQLVNDLASLTAVYLLHAAKQNPPASA
ncbi:hypothetical protein AGRA3207_004624 [Actinomadura graeca]|uniref:Uncharacterized protein n=1 Tax=Actinomadura graeca TaxID=2750812 RepID=A0ABX8QX94_9ACTN|nr:hypothetical protein [Actinomadura graeca]QXJ23470.1 hypothetical protein AGRA3207_004624 [Actinomadura graeca]